MKTHKTTVNLTSENWEKICMLSTETGSTQTDLINQCIAGVPIVNIGNQKSIAQSFFDIKKWLSDTSNCKLKEEVTTICLLLNSVMEKIEELMHSNKV